MTGSRFAQNRNRRWLDARSVLELAAIFIGVTSAFFVENFREDLEDQERRRQITAVLERELHTYVDRAPAVVDEMTRRLDDWERRRAALERPPPAYYRESAAETPPTAVWQAAVASGGVNLLDADLFYDLAFYYHRLTSVSQRYIRYNAFTERELLPRLKIGADAFYNGPEGELDEAFQAHMDLLGEIRDELAALGKIGARLLDDLSDEDGEYP
jgi:hypothetical protein